MNRTSVITHSIAPANLHSSQQMVSISCLCTTVSSVKIGGISHKPKTSWRHKFWFNKFIVSKV